MKRAIVIAAAALACALAAAPASAQVSDGVVKFGVLTDLSGPSADGTGKGSVVAAQMAIEDFGGTVLGKPVELTFADHQSKTDIGLATARRWYDVEQVDVILDVPVSSIALGVQQLTRDKNKVFLMAGPGSSELTGAACSPNGIQWVYNTYALANVAGKALAKRGDDTWFFITADYTFGHQLERDATAVVEANGGKVLGSAKHPFNNADFASQVLQAQTSKAKVVALADSGQDTQNVIKQAAEFGLVSGGQKLIGLLFGITDVPGVGLDIAQGMMLTDAFYWDKDDETRAFAKRFYDKIGRMPTMMQAGIYSAVSHYLKAVTAAKTDEAKAVVAEMKKTPINDLFAKNGHIRDDGQMIHDMHLVQVKSPAESSGKWDVYKIVDTVPGDQAFQSLASSACPLVKK
ncbi:ABC transporter substrate-binding protein [Chelatococcus reniformis]|uniref:ABC transporter substrate-binding protein n=1 Tax=Chelatococcus reniformis TaxID=1494448 RepID=A0A916X7X8_9HYPH|nr:ABC transporter substrate-binding protein [Chelatococcus reniformis]GGC49011.1 ABC transporter substrate-binding protein [Chelatococcus reniformis]